MLSTILGFITKPLGTIVGGYQARKTVALNSQTKIAEAKVELEVTKIKAEIEQVTISATRDSDYDMQVLKNRNNTYADEFIILVWFVLFLLHFVPEYATVMAQGWAAMGYKGAPWWFEFGMVGILISTLGLMRLFKLWISNFKHDTKNKQESNVGNL